MKWWLRASVAGACGLMLAVGGLWLYAGSYGFHVLSRHGATYWINVPADDPRLSASMRLALSGPPPVTSGPFAWQQLRPGFEVAELRAIANDREVDRILLARIDPARFRFEVHNSPAGDRDLDQWMTKLGAALVINGSYYSRYGTPVTPVLSGKLPLGPGEYNAKAGAFVASASFTGVRDLMREDWHQAFRDADDAMVSFPLLVSEEMPRLTAPSRWLANRSFVGRDRDGWIVLGTTSDAFFSLDRLGAFLQQAPLRLVPALNLDGGPVACQGIAIDGFDRRIYGKWKFRSKAATCNCCDGYTARSRCRSCSRCFQGEPFEGSERLAPVGGLDASICAAAVKFIYNK
jgi:hypothetical protein